MALYIYHVSSYKEGIFISCNSTRKQFQCCGVYISRVILKRSSFIVLAYIYITCHSTRKQFKSCGVYISRVILKRSSFIVLAYIYHLSFYKEVVLKLRCIYHVSLKVTVYIDHVSFYKEAVL